MQESRGILDDDNKSHGDSLEKTKQKERHIVSWSQEEDDILREQIRYMELKSKISDSLLFQEKIWTAIASKFKDKTTRQCRRRWFTYLNSDFKKGGWSPEEDMLLCETQKVFGNRWTEIAKVVSGRTDNAVKNRFNTLCKKKVKHEALAKENSMASYINLNNKRVVCPSRLDSEAGYENAVPSKKTRTNISNATENYCSDEKLARECMIATQPLKHLTVFVAQDFCSSECNFSTQPLGSYMKEASTGKSAIKKTQGTFLKKDDPKVLELMQQAEFLSSLADEIKSEKRDLNRESAWMVLQDFLKQNKESDTPKFKKWDADFELKKVKVLVDASSCSNEYAAPLLGQPISYESSPESSEYSTRSTHFFSDALCGEGEELQAPIFLLHKRPSHDLQSDQSNDLSCLDEESGMCHVETADEVDAMLTTDGVNANDGIASEFSNTKFTSPVQVTPMFRALAATIPSPEFSESEKHFLMKTLGLDSSLPTPMLNQAEAPLCKRSLLHCL